MKMLQVVVGGQFGSEAKGHVTHRLVRDAARHGLQVVNVRVAGPNAGHTAYLYRELEAVEQATKFAFRQVPVGAAMYQPCTLIIAPGSEIDPDVLLEEIDSAKGFGLLDNKAFYVSPHATVIEESHKRAEAAGRETNLIARVGSTGKGIGAARAERLMRRASRVGDLPLLVRALADRGIAVADYEYQAHDYVIVEGTQGYGLGLHTDFYPQCTSSGTRAIDFLAMAGISPWGNLHTVNSATFRIWVTARMFPIRVAGNSGPLYEETTWDELGLPPEYTTVTKKERRVGQWDQKLVEDAVKANGGRRFVRLALTMTDQKWPQMAGVKSLHQIENKAEHVEFFELVNKLDSTARVDLVTTGPHTSFYMD